MRIEATFVSARLYLRIVFTRLYLRADLYYAFVFTRLYSRVCICVFVFVGLYLRVCICTFILTHCIYAFVSAELYLFTHFPFCFTRMMLLCLFCIRSRKTLYNKRLNINHLRRFLIAGLRLWKQPF